MVAKKKSAVKKLAAKKQTAKKPVAKKPVGKKPTVKKPAAKARVARKPAPAAKKIAIKPVRKPLKAKPVKKPSGPAGLPEQLRAAALKVLDDRQAEDIVSFDMRGRSSMADYVIIASARAARQGAAIVHYLREAFAKLGVTQLRAEGVNEGNWVLVDGGDIIIHLFRPEVRSYYNLEQIWQRRAQSDGSEPDEEVIEV